MESLLAVSNENTGHENITKAWKVPPLEEATEKL